MRTNKPAGRAGSLARPLARARARASRLGDATPATASSEANRAGCNEPTESILDLSLISARRPFFCVLPAEICLSLP